MKSFIDKGDGMLAADNYCHIYNSPALTFERLTQYQRATYTVMGVCHTPKKINLQLKDIGTKGKLLSLPKKLQDLACYIPRVSLY